MEQNTESRDADPQFTNSAQSKPKSGAAKLLLGLWTRIGQVKSIWATITYFWPTPVKDICLIFGIPYPF